MYTDPIKNNVLLIGIMCYIKLGVINVDSGDKRSGLLINVN